MAEKLENDIKTENKEAKTKTKKQKEKPIYYDNHINEWLRNYLDEKHKIDSKKINKDETIENVTKSKTIENVAEDFGMSASKINRIVSGYATFDANEIIKISEVTGIQPNDLLVPRNKLPDYFEPENIDLMSIEGYNILCKHIQGPLFPCRDNFLIFLDYMICDEDLIKGLSDKTSEILEEFKQNKDTVKLIGCEDFETFQNKLKNENKELSQKLNDLITDKQIRQDIREFICRYIYNELKKEMSLD